MVVLNKEDELHRHKSTTDLLKTVTSNGTNKAKLIESLIANRMNNSFNSSSGTQYYQGCKCGTSRVLDGKKYCKACYDENKIATGTQTKSSPPPPPVPSLSTQPSLTRTGSICSIVVNNNSTSLNNLLNYPSRTGRLFYAGNSGNKKHHSTMNLMNTSFTTNKDKKSNESSSGNKSREQIISTTKSASCRKVQSDFTTRLICICIINSLSLSCESERVLTIK